MIDPRWRLRRWLSRLAPKKEIGVYINNLMNALASIPADLSDEEWSELFRAVAKACPPSVVQKLCAPQHFTIWEAAGIHITPNHYYQPIPDSRTIAPDTFTRRSELPGIDLREAEQLALLARFGQAYRVEYEAFPKHPEEVSQKGEFHLYNRMCGPVDAEILYCMVREHKPKRMIEFGSGFSTQISARALLQNEKETGVPCDFTAVEPYPNAMVRKGFPGLTRLCEMSCQEFPLEQIESLGENDILFIDSSHVLKIGSDVQHLFLEVLPRLKKGVVVQVHDIFLPFEYSRNWVMHLRRFWSEQYILQAFMIFNRAFAVLWAGNFMATTHKDKIAAAFPSYLGSGPGAFWMRKIE